MIESPHTRETDRGRRRPRRALIAAVLVSIAALVGAGAAFAYVELYSADFRGKGKIREMSKYQGGKRCAKGFVKNRRAMRLAVRRGPGVCAFRIPMAGDRARPDHDIRARMSVAGSTPKAKRKSAYLSVMLRAGGRENCATGRATGYELRVFPGTRRFQLHRRPAPPGGSEFPVRGREQRAINGLRKANNLRLRADGARITALVNGRRVARVEDPDPNPVRGCALVVGSGQTARAGRPTVVQVHRVRAGVPSP